jgi:sodium/bile acid cotransporter 7
MTRPRYLPDNATLLLFLVLLLAILFPSEGKIAVAFDWMTVFMIGLLFFMHGAKLSRTAVVAGMTHWRLHLVVLACTFVVFPIIAIVFKPVLVWLTTPELYVGILYLCLLPSTVQSSIAFTAVAKGNVPAAICSASASNLLGVFLTPVLVGLLIVSGDADHGFMDSILKIVCQLFLPFVAGQLMQPLIGRWVDKNKSWLKWVDQASVMLVVYVAFSEAHAAGIWQQFPMYVIVSLLGISAVLLAMIMCLTMYGSRKMGFNKEDEIAIVFCGSKKSMASGVPMAKVLFASSTVGMMVLPLILFHQLQLIVCAIMAQKYSQRPDENTPV